MTDPENSPLIFVDVDGVLNPITPSESHARLDLTLPGGAFTVFLSPNHGEDLLQLALETNAELVWGTMWEDHANEYVGPNVGLPYLPVMKIYRAKMSSLLGQDKAYSAQLYAKGRKFVYFDDEKDIGYHLQGSNCKHIWVDPEYGLKEDHLVKAREFLLAAQCILDL